MDYQQILSDAFELLDSHEDMEPKSALKQAAIMHGVQTGKDLEAFVNWALDNSIIGIF
jgi:hypothetical protein